PGIGDTEGIFLLRDKWHFHFYGETPLKLVAGRERIYLEHFWNDFAADPKHSVSDRDRRIYTRAYAQKGGMRSTMEYFANFEKDAEDFKAFSKVKLEQPMLVLTGEKASGQFLIDQSKRVDTNVEGVIVKGSGHWLMDEATAEVVPLLVKFID
ncbi:MAG TPA: alpha/beta hydrolase, partial [Usitatibacter sp.]|nr:alpha/beta hydrolase [Usitatibacter sp.]